MVGCESVTWSCTSQAHMPTPFPMEHWPFCFSSRRIFTRAGSATALSARTSCLSVRGIVLYQYTQGLILVNAKIPLGADFVDQGFRSECLTRSKYWPFQNHAISDSSI